MEEIACNGLHNPGESGQALRDEERLCLLLARGDKDSFDLLFHRYYPRLWRFLTRYLGCPATAEDLAQETFLRAYQTRRRIRPAKSLLPWLFTIALNLARDHLRRTRLAVPATALVEELPQTPTSADAVHSQVAAREFGAQLELALRRLPAPLREVFLLARESQMSGAEVARALRCSPSAARKRLSRAMHILTKELASWLDQANDE